MHDPDSGGKTFDQTDAATSPLLAHLNPEQLAAVTLPAQSALKRVIKAMNLDEERFVPRQVSWFIAGSKEEGLRPRDVEAHDPQARKMVEIYQAYEDQCQREGVVDFGELMLRSYELLRDH